MQARVFVGVVGVAFFFLNLLGSLNHEMWSDELMFWMIARDSSSWGDLLQTLRFEYMHPVLWGVLLYGISRFTRDPLAMQVFHSLIATGAVVLLVTYAPFPRWQKLLLTFGYFFVYEYSVISRNYGLGVLLIFLFCGLFHTRRRGYLPLACVLVLLANVNFYSRMTAIALAAMLLLEGVRNQTLTKPTVRRKWDLIFSGLIFGGGLLLSAIQNIPPNTGHSLGLLSGGPQIVSALANLWRAYFPMPGLALGFWNSNIIDDGFAAALFWIPLGFSIALFYSRPLILFFYLFNLTEIVLFHSLWTGLMRHLGYIFIGFIACLWLSQEIPAQPRVQPVKSDPLKSDQVHNRVWAFFDRYQVQFVSVVLVVQVVAGIYAYGMDLFNPFSESKNVAQFIRRQSPAPFVAAGIDVFSQSVSGYLDQPIFYPERDRLGTYISSDNKASRLSPQQFLERVATANVAGNALLVLNRPWETPFPVVPGWQLSKVADFQQGIVKVENYTLYSFQRVASNS